MLFQADDTMRNKSHQLYDKSQKSIEQDVRIVREWLKSQPHLPEVMEDIKIANFLILNKYSIEKTKQKIDSYYTVRTLLGDFFKDSNPRSSLITNLMEKTYCGVLPQAFEGLYRIYYIKPKQINSLLPHEIGLQCTNSYEVRLCQDCVVGDVIVYDMSTTSLSDITRITPTLLSKLLTLYSVFSMRIRAVYIVNSPTYVATLLSLLKGILKPKIFSRIHVCEDVSILKSTFPKDQLPKDYGGEAPSLDELNEMLISMLKQYQSRYDLLDTLKVDETKRPQKLNNDALLGFHGNFKQLSVD